MLFQWKTNTTEVLDGAPEAFPHVPLPLLQALAGRGILEVQEIEAYLNPNYARDVHDPFLFSDMKRFVERISDAIDKNELIAIHGDYDADGVTSSAILATIFEALGANVIVFLPHRERDGYGMNAKTVERFKEQGVALIITADCGIANIEPIAHARGLSMDVMIVDHHEQKETLPDALAIIHPIVDKQYPDKTLTGGGASFKVLQALVRSDHPTIVRAREAYANTQAEGFSWEGFEKWSLDLAAISTVADCTRLTGESRALVHWGLKVLPKTRRPGLRALVNRAVRGPMDARSIGFGIAPRINAPGRMDHAQRAYELLMETDPERIEVMAKSVESMNERRKELTQQITDEAIAMVGSAAPSVIVVYQSEWFYGVLGIVASRLSELYGRPAIALARVEDRIVGSGRAPRGHNLLELLDRAQALLVQYGGHKQACGLTVENEERVNALRLLLNTRSDGDVDAGSTLEECVVDADLGFAEATMNLVEWIERCEPFGIGNLPLRFRSTDCQILSSRTFKESKHLELILKQNRVTRRIVGFNWGARFKEFLHSRACDVVYELRRSTYGRGEPMDFILVDAQVI